MKKPILIVITGPTAVGKTTLSIELAQKLKTEIISADSRQIYKEMSIGTARPDSNQLSAVPHHFIGTQSIFDYYNASMFENQVLTKLQELFQKYPVLLMVGGSGLYIDAVCYGIDDLPTIDPSVRKAVMERYKLHGIEVLRNELTEIDPKYAAEADLSNPKRIFKALEVYYMTGRPYSSFLTRKAKERFFDFHFIVIDRPRNELHQNINNRVDQMIQQGLIDEARQLFPYKHLNALNTVGYKELFEYFDKKIDLADAIEQIKRNTRRYARRQITWFKRYERAQWFHPDNRNEIFNYVEQLV